MRDSGPSGRCREPPARTRVLVTEDDLDLRDIVTGFLEDEGWTVVAVANGGDALELATTEPFAVVVIDVPSRASEGLVLLQTLRARSADLPIVVITSFGDAHLSARATSLGATQLLEKPFELEELASALARAT